MKRSLIVLICFFCFAFSTKHLPSNLISGLKTTVDTLPKTVATQEDSNSIKTEPAYPGGQQGWMRHLVRTLRYPAYAFNNNIQGTVIVKFTIDEKGRVKHAEAISGEKDLRAEAVRVVRESGKWIPATLNGKAIKSEREQTMTFKREFPEDEQKKSKDQ